MQKNICVFAGGSCSKKNEHHYYTVAYETGKLLATAGYTVVSGGGMGLMNETLRGCAESGGETIAVLLENRPKSAFISKEFSYPRIRLRQQKLIALGDAYIAIPGGIGTLYEILEIIELKRMLDVSRDTPLIVIDSYYNPLKKMIHNGYTDGFIQKEIMELVTFVKHPAQAVDILNHSFNLSPITHSVS